MDYLEINNLTLTYYNKKTKNTFLAIDNISVDFPLGKTTVIIGEIGAGKSSLLNVISGILPYDSGTLSYKGLDLDKIYIEDRNFSYITQNTVLINKKTIFDNLVIPLAAKKVKRDEIRHRIYSILEEFDIGHLVSRKPNEISLGQLQKIIFAKATLKEPDLYLLDEPFSSLDTQSRIEFRSFLKKTLKTKKSSCILVPHNIEDALYLADYLVVMKNGKISFSGSIEEALNTTNKDVIELLKAEEINHEEN